jgi:hypothetical protein
LHSEFIIGCLLFLNMFFVLYPNVLSLFSTVVTTALF